MVHLRTWPLALNKERNAWWQVEQRFRLLRDPVMKVTLPRLEFLEKPFMEEPEEV